MLQPIARTVSKAAALFPHKAAARERALVLFREATERFDADHITYLVERNIVIWDLLPARLIVPAVAWVVRYADLLDVLTDEDFIAIAQTLRPECAELLTSEPGQRWLRHLLGWRSL